MNVGIVGLGLIGGSLARAYKQNSDAKIFALDTGDGIVDIAKIAGVVDGELNADTIRDCRLIFIALYPRATIEFLIEYAPIISEKAYVIDCCGIKREICAEGFRLAERYGFTFIGGHPMAGIHYSGFKHSKSNMFRGAPMIIIPPRYDDISLLEKVKELLRPAGFGRISVTTADKHDKVIAFTSQMAHVVSNAYIKSPTARAHRGHSAGSYRDLTRVAWLNETMWTELFIGNRDNLIRELDILISSLEEYKDALEQADAERLTELLAHGRRCKEEVDGR
ncbi:MAG: prephenate dehydrogenase [Clostridiales bacterium]|jgi:prephenate dehydrogenase|nr:prephenate dehydrogenase [Clostridiales bacterium]